MTGDSKNMIRILTKSLGLAIALYVTALPLVGSHSADANADDGATLEQKIEWQDRYRSLLVGAARLKQAATTSRENYARAQRRNYPRGGARQQFIIDAEDAENELVDMNGQIEAILDEARRNAIPTVWFYEVDDEPIRLPPPVRLSRTNESADPNADQDEDDDGGGRNPLYDRD